MKTSVILLCFSVFLISVEGRSQPVKRVCPPIPLIYVREKYCPSTPESPECSSDDDCSSRNQLCCYAFKCTNRFCTDPRYVPYY
ncbi:hypothetical protein Anas_12958 [Armadillidium nasatum]|uniref:WAP domain-containing protein n=1 Tax=Armadillidium nasatum TaxID=96803 RepID=A0A5N5T798_9CRUS|nr:hypothetical protein Anas_12958 [Armadillidium nasatum]